MQPVSLRRKREEMAVWAAAIGFYMHSGGDLDLEDERIRPVANQRESMAE